MCRVSHLLLALLCVLWTPGAARAQRETRPESVRTIPAWRVAPVVLGEVLVPLLPAGGASDQLLAMRRVWVPESPGRATLDDGSKATVRVRRLVPSLFEGATRGEGTTWYAAPLLWTEDAGDVPLLRGSVWLAEVRVPAGTRWLEMSGRRIDLFTPPTHHRASLSAPNDQTFGNSIARVDRDVTERWRCAWLGCATDGVIDDPLADAWSEAIRARWDEAARRVGDADPGTLHRLEHRLVAIASPAGVPLPMWTPDRDAWQTLLRELLEPGASDQTLIDGVLAWLERTPPVVCWVIDDAPAIEEGQLPSAEIGFVSLDARPIVPLISTLRGPARLAPRVPPGRMPTTVRLPVGREGASDTVIASSGGWETRVGVVTGAIDAVPPGFLTGDFFYDHTRASLSAGARPPAINNRPTRAVLTRLEPGTWQLVVESVTGTEATNESVSLWLGDRGAGRAPVSIRPDSPGLTSGSVRAWSREENGRWLAGFVFTEQDVRDGDGLLRLAIVRTDHAGDRSAWPRPLLPGQRVPGRLAIDPSLWASPVE